MSVVETLEAEYIKMKRAVLLDMLEKCTTTQKASFRTIFANKDVPDFQLNSAIDLVERTLKHDGKTSRWMVDEN